MCKALLVILYFMHVRYSDKLTWVFAAAGFFWLLILIGGTMDDVLTRPSPLPVTERLNTPRRSLSVARLICNRLFSLLCAGFIPDSAVNPKCRIRHFGSNVCDDRSNILNDSTR